MEHALEQDRLDTEGPMTIAPLNRDPSVARSCFARLRECRDRLADRFGIRLPELSMGMSGDLGEAILEGSTLVRVVWLCMENANTNESISYRGIALLSLVG